MADMPSREQGGPSPASPLVLLVDDCEDSREMYACYLTTRGFAVVEAGTGQDAIDQAAALAPQIIIMDLSLPDMAGDQAIDRIKSDARSAGARVLVVSGRSVPQDGRPESWDGFLVKPCPPDLLDSAIRRLLAGRPAPARA